MVIYISVSFKRLFKGDLIKTAPVFVITMQDLFTFKNIFSIYFQTTMSLSWQNIYISLIWSKNNKMLQKQLIKERDFHLLISYMFYFWRLIIIFVVLENVSGVCCCTFL